MPDIEAYFEGLGLSEELERGRKGSVHIDIETTGLDFAKGRKAPLQHQITAYASFSPGSPKPYTYHYFPHLPKDFDLNYIDPWNIGEGKVFPKKPETLQQAQGDIKRFFRRPTPSKGVIPNLTATKPTNRKKEYLQPQEAILRDIFTTQKKKRGRNKILAWNTAMESTYIFERASDELWRSTLVHEFPVTRSVAERHQKGAGHLFDSPYQSRIYETIADETVNQKYKNTLVKTNLLGSAKEFNKDAFLNKWSEVGSIWREGYLSQAKGTTFLDPQNLVRSSYAKAQKLGFLPKTGNVFGGTSVSFLSASLLGKKEPHVPTGDVNLQSQLTDLFYGLDVELEKKLAEPKYRISQTAADTLTRLRETLPQELKYAKANSVLRTIENEAEDYTIKRSTGVSTMDQQVLLSTQGEIVERQPFDIIKSKRIPAKMTEAALEDIKRNSEKFAGIPYDPSFVDFLAEQAALDNISSSDVEAERALYHKQLQANKKTPQIPNSILDQKPIFSDRVKKVVDQGLDDSKTIEALKAQLDKGSSLFTGRNLLYATGAAIGLGVVYNSIEGLHPQAGELSPYADGMDDFGSGWKGLFGALSTKVSKLFSKTATKPSSTPFFRSSAHKETLEGIFGPKNIPVSPEASFSPIKLLDVERHQELTRHLEDQLSNNNIIRNIPGEESVSSRMPSLEEKFGLVNKYTEPELLMRNPLVQHSRELREARRATDAGFQPITREPQTTPPLNSFKKDLLKHNEANQLRRLPSSMDQSSKGIKTDFGSPWHGPTVSLSTALSMLNKGSAHPNDPHPELSPEYNKATDIPAYQLARGSKIGLKEEELYKYFTQPEKEMSEFVQASAAAGTALHQYMQGQWYKEGHIKAAEELVYDPVLNISGHIDAIDARGRIGDIKTVSSGKFRALEKKGQPYPAHISQITSYMGITGVTEKGGFISYISRDNPQDVLTFNVPYKQALFNKDIRKLQKVRNRISREISEGILDENSLPKAAGASTLIEAARHSQGEVQRHASNLDDNWSIFQDEMNWLESTKRGMPKRVKRGKRGVDEKDLSIYNAIYGSKRYQPSSTMGLGLSLSENRSKHHEY